MCQDGGLILCGRHGRPAPTGREWDSLMQAWHHGKAPIESVGELQKLRAA